MGENFQRVGGYCPAGKYLGVIVREAKVWGVNNSVYSTFLYSHYSIPILYSLFIFNVTFLYSQIFSTLDWRIIISYSLEFLSVGPRVQKLI